jgi:hypothetical protein
MRESSNCCPVLNIVNEQTLVEKTDKGITFRNEYDTTAGHHIYKEAFPTCQFQDRKTIYNIHQHLRKRGTLVFVEAEKEDTRLEMDNEIMKLPNFL